MECIDTNLFFEVRVSYLLELLPPAYVVRGKVMFWHQSVCLSTLARGYPIPGLAGGYPIPGLDGGYLIPGLDRVPPPPQTWDGVPPPGPGTGYPPGPGMGSPWTWDGVPPQHSEHLLWGGRYASCVHAGGLSCCICQQSQGVKLHPRCWERSLIVLCWDFWQRSMTKTYLTVTLSVLTKVNIQKHARSLPENNVKHGVAIDEWILLFYALSGCLWIK